MGKRCRWTSIRDETRLLIVFRRHALEGAWNLPRKPYLASRQTGRGFWQGAYLESNFSEPG